MAQDILISKFNILFNTDQPTHIPLGDFLSDVRRPPKLLKDAVLRVRKATTKEEIDLLKKRLYCVTPSGVFGSREDDKLKHQSGIVCIDIDKIAIDVDGFKSQLCGNSLVMAAFISPSGKGIKAFVKHDLKDTSLFRYLYHEVGEALGISGRSDMEFDLRCSNISRACFYSYDPGLYYNEQSEVFHFDATAIPPATVKAVKTASTIVPVSVPILTDQKSIEEAIIREQEWFEQKYSMYPGTRNSNLYILACLFRNAGIPEDTASDYLIAYYSDQNNGFSGAEIASTVRSSYAKKSDF